MNPTDEQIRDLLRHAKTVAVVGLSDNPQRPSYGVAQYLISAGYTVIPVNPNVESVLGLRSHDCLEDVPDHVDIVDVFRRPEHLPEIANSAIAVGAGALWAQLGVVNEEAAELARSAGLMAVMDRCTAIEHRRLAAQDAEGWQADE